MPTRPASTYYNPTPLPKPPSHYDNVDPISVYDEIRQSNQLDIDKYKLEDLDDKQKNDKAYAELLKDAQLQGLDPMETVRQAEELIEQEALKRGDIDTYKRSIEKKATEEEKRFKQREKRETLASKSRAEQLKTLEKVNKLYGAQAARAASDSGDVYGFAAELLKNQDIAKADGKKIADNIIEDNKGFDSMSEQERIKREAWLRSRNGG